MVDQGGLNWAKEQQKSGISIDDISASLKSSGYEDSMISEIVEALKENASPEINENSSPGQFKSLGFLKFLFLLIITLGLYLIKWFKDFNKGAGEENKIKPALFYFYAIITFTSNIFSIISEIIANNIDSISTDILNGPIGLALLAFSNIIGIVSLAAFILHIVTSFIARGILVKKYQEKFSGLGTFLFGPLYLQVRINTLNKKLNQ